MQTICYITRDNGDATASVLFFKDVALAESLIQCDDSSENGGSFAMNSEVTKLTFPDVVDLDQCGFYFSDEDYK